MQEQAWAMNKVHQRTILKALAKGAVIRCEYVNYPPSSTRCTYRLSNTQQLIRKETVERLVKDRLIRPNADGLFGADGPPQSYSLWRASEGGA
jgi:hypothetical protein